MLIPKDTYPAQTDDGDPAYPQGKAQNVTVTGAGNGSPLEKDWLNDLWGFFQALVDAAGITPSGAPDQVGTSDLLDALKVVAQVTLVNSIKACIPGLASSYTDHIAAGALPAHRNDDDRFVQGVAGSGAVWTQDSIADAGNLRLAIKMPPIGPSGAKLTSVKLWVAPLTDHSALPATMPKFTVFQASFTGNNPSVLSSSAISSEITDPAASETAFDTPHEITVPCGDDPIVAGKVYSIGIKGEAGANAQTGFTILEVRPVIAPP